MDSNIQTSVLPTGQESLGVYNPFQQDTRVYLTLPDGRRVGFTFSPEKHDLPGVTYYTPAYQADAGLDYNLSPAGAVPTVGRRRQPNDQKPRARIAKARDRPAPVLLRREAPHSHARHLAAPAPEARALLAGHDLGRHTPERVPHASMLTRDGRRRLCAAREAEAAGRATAWGRPA